jgi:hypothetical protein
MPVIFGFTQVFSQQAVDEIKQFQQLRVGHAFGHQFHELIVREFL